jgi:hypothetical protein
MARLRLRTQLLVATLLIVLTLLAAVLLVVRRSRGIKASKRLLSTVQFKYSKEK